MIHEELHRLERLAGQVAKKIQQVEQENSALRQQLTETMNIVKQKEESLEHFKNQIKISKIVNNIPVENKASAELRERIDNYIKEIDKIVDYLSG
jgi:phage shock protein A